MSLKTWIEIDYGPAASAETIAGARHIAANRDNPEDAEADFLWEFGGVRGFDTFTFYLCGPNGAIQTSPVDAEMLGNTATPEMVDFANRLIAEKTRTWEEILEAVNAQHPETD